MRVRQRARAGASGARSGSNPRVSHPDRQSLPAHLPQVEEVLACAPSHWVCSCCGAETTVIGYETSEVLDVKAAEYFVELTKRKKRACKRCEEQGAVAAPLAARIIDKSLVSDRVFIDTRAAYLVNVIGAITALC